MIDSSLLRAVRAGALALVLGASASMAQAIEEPAYTVLREYPGFEVREYAPRLVAEVRVSGPTEEAGNRGFRPLAGYIFGGNKGARSIAMTAPVTQSAAPTQIAMTAPVTQQPAGDATVVQFTMPAEFSLATLPEPLDPQVRLREEPAARYAVIRYSGSWSQENYLEHLRKLESGVKAAGLRVRGEPVYARYNAPYVPWFMRRNEIWLPVD